MQINKVCSVCDNRIDRYLPLPDFYFKQALKYGYSIEKCVPETGNRIEYSCPVCGAADRERLYAMYLKELFTNAIPDDKFIFLDIAPAKPLQKFINENFTVDYRSLDFLMEDVTYNDNLMNIASIKSNTINYVLCSHVLEHVDNDRKALSEIYRIMKPGASGIVMVPLDLTMQETEEDINATEAEKWKRFGQNDHVRKYSKSDFLQKLESTDFFVTELGINHFGMDKFYANGLIQSSILYTIEKQN